MPDHLDMSSSMARRAGNQRELMFGLELLPQRTVKNTVDFFPLGDGGGGASTFDKL